MIADRDRFDSLLAEWRKREDAIDQLKNEQNETAQQISQTFAAIVTEEQLLAHLPWKFSIYGSGASISCHLKDERAAAFIKKMLWEENRYFWHTTLSIGENLVHLDDNEMTVHMNSIDALIEFCKAQGIKPDLTALNDQRDRAQSEADRVTAIIDKLCAG